jgi:DNA-binding NarL/FixJ family response regulator
VLQLIAEGHTNNAVAQILRLSVKTVEKHRTNLMSKLNVHDLAGLIRIAIKHGLVFLDE